MTIKVISPSPPHPPRKITYPKYSQAEIDAAMLQVIRYVMSIPEERLAPKLPAKEQANNGKA